MVKNIFKVFDTTMYYYEMGTVMLGIFYFGLICLFIFAFMDGTSQFWVLFTIITISSIWFGVKIMKHQNEKAADYRIKLTGHDDNNLELEYMDNDESIKIPVQKIFGRFPKLIFNKREIYLEPKRKKQFIGRLYHWARMHRYHIKINSK